MRFRIANTSAALVLGAAAWFGVAHARARTAPPLALSTALSVYGMVPAFSLTDQRATPVTREALSGHVWIADFIFTACPGQCLLMTDQFQALQRTFADDEGLRFVSFSVDPAQDTPEVLAAYARRHGADARWRLVTGERDAIASLCADGFRLSFAQAAESAQEPIVHSVRLVLVDRAGRIRGYYDATDAQDMAQLRDDARRLLGEGA